MKSKLIKLGAALLWQVATTIVLKKLAPRIARL